MKYTHRNHNGFIERKALEYWSNFITHLEDKIDEREFFDFFVREDVSQLTLELIRKDFTDGELDEMTYHFRDKKIRGSISELLFDLWNEQSTQGRVRAAILKVTESCLEHVKRGRKGESEKRIDYVASAFGLNEIEKELLTLVFVAEICGIKYPCLRFGELADKANVLAMSIDRSFEEVLAALGGGCRLRKFNCLAEDLSLVRDPVGDYLSGSGTGALESNYYVKTIDKTLPWSYFGELAEKEGALLKRIIKSRQGAGGVNILFYGEPGTGKTSFAKCLAQELGFETYEILQGEKNGKGISAATRITGIKLGNERLPVCKTMMLVDEADEILRTNTFGFGLLFGGIDAHGGEKGVVNALLDEIKLPTIWIVNTPAEAMDPSVRRRFDFSICFRSMSVRQRELIWRNNVEKYELGGLVPATLSREFAERYETSAGGIAVVAKNLAALKPRKSEVKPLMERLIVPHCALVGVAHEQRGERLTDGYSLEGLNIRNNMPLDKIAQSVRSFYEANGDGFDASRPRLNILLWGPPGTGKTEFAKFLAAKSGHKLRVKTGSGLLSKWVGGTEHNIANAFKDAEDDRAILFLDEIDGLVQARGKSDHAWEVSQVNELLHAMENFNGVLIGATNFFDNLDPAIMRRFTFKVKFDFLDNDGKVSLFERIFNTSLSGEETSSLQRIDNVTPGDMAVVRQNLFYLGGGVTNADRIAALEQEIECKRNYHPRTIGFGQ